MKKTFVIGLDVGTTAIKGLLIDKYGEIYALNTIEYQLETKAPQIFEIDPNIYWKTVIQILKNLLLISKVPAQNIAAIAISSQGETFVPVDHAGDPLRKAIVWLDTRSTIEAQKIVAHFGQAQIYQITGQPETIPMWPATKILWLKRNEPHIFRKTYRFLLVEDYLIYKLTGQYVSEQSLVSSTLLYNIHTKNWWTDMLTFIGLAPDQLPPVKQSGVPIASLTDQAVKETGLSPNTVVVTGAYDHPAGAIGVGNIHTGTISETTGTAMAMCVTLDEPIINPKLNLPCQCHAIPNKYFLLPYGNTAGMVLKWFRDNFSEKEQELAQQQKLDVYDIMTAMAAKVPPGCEGLVMFPHLTGTGSPEFNIKAKGIFAGITPHTQKAHFIRAIMEAIACMVKANIDSLADINYQVNEIRTLGGGAKSPLWNQIKADMLGIPVLTLQSKEVAAALGVAILAGTGIGLFKNIEEACEFTVKHDQKFIPNPDNFEIYQHVFKQYSKLSELSKDFFNDSYLT